MVLIRRLMTGLLTLAVTHFGVLATAPAHAHEDPGGHGVREIVLSHQDAEPAAHHHGGAGHDGHERATLEAATDTESKESRTGDASHGEHAHVHVCPQFAPISGRSALAATVMQLEMAWPVRAAPAVSYLSSPPLRPPRQLL